MIEYLDVVDENGEPTGEIVDRERAHAEGIRHRTAHLWLARKRGGATQVLLQKRAAHKSSFPGCYDISSAGHIPAGDGYVQSALRELQEELGVVAMESQLIFCGDRKVTWDDCFFGKPFHDRQCSRVFMMWLDLDEGSFTVDPREVDSVLWMDMDECISGVRQGTLKSCIAMEELLMLKKTLERQEGSR